MTTLLTLLASSLPVAALWIATAMHHQAQSAPIVTDPGAEAYRRLTTPQPMPTGRHRKPWGITQ